MVKRNYSAGTKDFREIILTQIVRKNKNRDSLDHESPNVITSFTTVWTIVFVAILGKHNYKFNQKGVSGDLSKILHIWECIVCASPPQFGCKIASYRHKLRALKVSRNALIIITNEFASYSVTSIYFFVVFDNCQVNILRLSTNCFVDDFNSSRKHLQTFISSFEWINFGTQLFSQNRTINANVPAPDTPNLYNCFSLHYFWILPCVPTLSQLRFSEIFTLPHVILAFLKVQALYHHPSLGKSLDIVLVRLEIMKRQPSDMYHYEGERSKLLDSFCSYQSRINPDNDDNPDHWDMALYVSG